VRALCAELLGRLSPLDPVAQHDATWIASAAPAVADELAEVRAKAEEIRARGGGEAQRARAMSVLLAEQGDDPATVDMTPSVGSGEETPVARGRRTRSSVALFLPGVVPPPAEAPEAKAEAEEPAQIGEESEGAGPAWSRRAPPYTPRSRRGRGS
jgi:hypothetical protein